MGSRIKGGDLKMKLRKKVIITFYIEASEYDELQEIRNTKFQDLTRPAFYRMLVNIGLEQIKKRG